MTDDPRPIARPCSPVEADEICARLRAAGIRCGSRSVPDPQDLDAVLGTFGREALEVFVDARDVDRARQVLAG